MHTITQRRRHTTVHGHVCRQHKHDRGTKQRTTGVTDGRTERDRTEHVGGGRPSPLASPLRSRPFPFSPLASLARCCSLGVCFSASPLSALDSSVAISFSTLLLFFCLSVDRCSHFSICRPVAAAGPIAVRCHSAVGVQRAAAPRGDWMISAHPTLPSKHKSHRATRRSGRASVVYKVATIQKLHQKFNSFPRSLRVVAFASAQKAWLAMQNRVVGCDRKEGKNV